jgi:pyruvate/2-oxoglutarate dehydrogenase complex dihydrolipoamide dehydrogenase (E3) component
VHKDGKTGELTLELEGGTKLGPFDAVLMATGRATAITGLGLDQAGISVDKQGYVQVDGALFFLFVLAWGTVYTVGSLQWDWLVAWGYE